MRGLAEQCGSAALAALLVAVLLAGGDGRRQPSRPGVGAVRERYARLPVAFEPNRGQADAGTAFLARGADYGIALRSTETLFALGKHGFLRVRLAGANSNASLVPEQRLPGRVNYLLGNDRSRWLTGVPTFARVRARNVYPGIDLTYHGRQGRLESDFLVRPGASPRAVTLMFSGARGLRLDGEGNLVVGLPRGALQELAPRAYQRVAGRRRDVRARFVLHGSRVGFAVAAYDRARPLVIDPPIYSSYVGGSGPNDIAHAVAVDASGNAYVAGEASANFPTTPGSVQATSAGSQDAFVAKLNTTGSALVYSTYLGGLFADRAFGIAIDADGNAYVTGQTSSTNFPTASPYQAANAGSVDAFVTKLNASGSALVYSTYLGGSTASPGLATADDTGQAIAVDADGNAYVAGQTSSTNFPTMGPVQTANAGRVDAFVTKLNAAGSALVYSTYLGGSTSSGGSVADDIAYGIAVDASGNAYVAGDTHSTNFPTASPYQAANAGSDDAFVTKLNASGSSLVYSTYLGGTVGDGADAVAVDAGGNAYVGGRTASTNFPTASPYQAANAGSVDAFVTKLNASGSSLVYSTYLGGGNFDHAHAIAVGSDRSAYVGGETQSANFPTASPVQPSNGGDTDAFVTKLSPSGSALAYSTYLGGSKPTTFANDIAHGIAVDGAGDVYAAGETRSTDFPTTTNVLQSTNAGGVDAFVSKLAPPSAPTAVTLRSFVARRSSRDVLLRWRTASESGLLGFNVYRGRTRLARALIPARGGAGGSSYSYLDRAAPHGRLLRYRLQAVSANGTPVWSATTRLPGR